jgi:hypothetical protein
MIAFIIQFVIAILVIILIIAFFISANRESEEKRKKRVLVEQSAKKAREASNAQRRELYCRCYPILILLWSIQIMDSVQEI